MNVKSSLRGIDCCSGNLKSKIQNLKWSGIVAIVVTFAMCGDVAQAQQAKKVPRIGYLSPASVSPSSAWIEAFRQGLRELGYVEGQNIAIEYRWAEGKADRLPDLAAELVRLKVDVIVVVGPAAAAAKKATKTIPIVTASAADPVASGLVDSLARPGGNITGLSIMAPELSGKRLELLKEAVPGITRIAVLRDPTNPGSALTWKETQVAARALGVQLQLLEWRSAKDIEASFAAMKSERAGALIPLRGPLIVDQRTWFVNLVAKSRLPAMYDDGDFVDAGGLMFYGPNRVDLHRRAATYVDKILKGTKPADLPVEQPTKFEFVINLKTAKQIGLTIPPNVLARADKVIK
jgi:putative ABC transport system substrate-binding protein